MVWGLSRFAPAAAAAVAVRLRRQTLYGLHCQRLPLSVMVLHKPFSPARQSHRKNMATGYALVMILPTFSPPPPPPPPPPASTSLFAPTPLIPRLPHLSAFHISFLLSHFSFISLSLSLLLAVSFALRLASVWRMSPSEQQQVCFFQMSLRLRNRHGLSWKIEAGVSLRLGSLWACCWLGWRFFCFQSSFAVSVLFSLICRLVLLQFFFLQLVGGIELILCLMAHQFDYCILFQNSTNIDESELYVSGLIVWFFDASWFDGTINWRDSFDLV